jgi:cyclopropane-fatty-acyl-phospholipid synthase
MEGMAKNLIERGFVPDYVTRMGIQNLLYKTSRSLQYPSVEQQLDHKRLFIQNLRKQPIALEVEEANDQHYEIPSEFFALCLGPHRKYSCCLFDGTSDLGEEERKMLELYCFQKYYCWTLQFKLSA